MPKALPREFREGVIRVFRESDASIAQVAKDFGISPSGQHRAVLIDDLHVVMVLSPVITHKQHPDSFRLV
ncbi:MAG: Transposase [Nocardioides sp.]|nr:Transposase [Nocardioides sp.]